MVSLTGSSATSLLRFLFLGLTTLASPSRAQVELHVPAGLTKLRAVEGAEVVLPAWYTLQGEVSSTKPKPWEVPTVIWFLLEGKNMNMSQVLAHISGVTSSKPGASLVYPMPSRNVSLRLQGLQEKDSGPYLCSVNLQDSQGTVRGHSSKTLELNVLDAIHGSLNLKNLSTSMSGVYICKAHNEVGSAQCNVTLKVSTGPEATVVAGAVVGTMVGLGLLVGLVLLYQRRGKALEEPANDIKEDAIAPRTLPWPKGSDTISKNGTLSSVTSARALRPPHGPPRPGALSPTPSLSSQVLPSPRLPRTDGAHPQPISPSPGGVSSSALSRMGAVPVMVPAQSQAGSLV
ncbi:endothelial cell-selective adhesion molecule-like isoform X2 [Balaenoptera musculus]|uniref:Endothelial cell-selective adhesion molecule-like isoform X2 n=1 Tax=Balaenoptera musculus TaxID=9771 RepID=A0A8B8Y880_BALMU|nr:endothelial cell-selective adhesion molecule-like isoform X2 [Balaenoptera musculus]